MKTIKVNEKDVIVTTEIAASGPQILLRAECDGVVREHTMTIGPADGAGPDDYGQAMLRRDLDAARIRVAGEAEWHARIRDMMKEVDK